jgi:carboxylesterase
MTTANVIYNQHLPGTSFFWEGGATGILLSHGYTATTAEVRPIARLLHTRGFTVTGPLLPGHGTDPLEMTRYRWQDWVASLEQSYLQLAQQCDTVFVGGESMGGLLSLYLAGHYPEIAGIMLHSPAVKLPRQSLFLTYLARPFIRQVYKKNMDATHPDWQGVSG